MKLVTGIDALDTPAMFASSRRRIILHAAVYGAFARSHPHREGLETALARPEFKRLDIIVLEPDSPACWVRPFLDALRFGISTQATDDEVLLSHRFMSELAQRHPDKVHLHPARRLPCLPIIIADDAIVFGQYAHAGTHAPQGFWGMVQADVQALLEWTARGKPPTWASGEEVAAFRLVNECARAMCPCRSFSTFPTHNLDHREFPANDTP
ncbi:MULTISPECIES: hypothetical protein [unclassified Pseudodesulfovibrio]|uniref:hypothetical protein n=1 Tax=unclassified Pseudodesulfovibrio TaxID=2661612 RepID=UPI000FEBCD36|nr:MULTISPECIES: hypothetical protein [unclassified Pseudodesulfovibrio]MCJ2164376.1 hypothetical protein [Pseudodesulfovibrio sp. S3-i]RWU04584.1 hypothetical protein DWB63_07460 [Pseudodesulfovibrio sp. S3]